LKNLIDHFMPEYFFKPTGIVSYTAGPFGGILAGEALRLIVAELGTPAIPSKFPISKVHEAFDDDGKDLTGDYDRRVKKFLDEFEWYVKTMKAGRKNGVPY